MSDSKRVRKKVPLKPGFTLANWVMGASKRAPVEQHRLVSWEMLEKHNTPDSLWIVIHGVVYDVTAYLDYHPGGSNILAKFGGRDASAAFQKYHAWVNLETLMKGRAVGRIEKRI